MAVRKAMQEMATEKVMELLKSDPKYVESLNKLIESNIVASFEAVAKRISQDLGESLVSAIENEFRTYGN
jgi:CHASE3 domain sensor protein